MIYRITEALIAGGYNAKVLIPGKNLYPQDNPPDYKPFWFDTELSVVDDVDVITSDDVVILHEEAVWAYDSVIKNNPRIIMLNQGLQASMVDMPSNVSWSKACQAYQNALGSIVVSKYIKQGIHKLFGARELRTHVINPARLIDNYFVPGIKTNTILVMLKSTARNNMATDMMLKVFRERYPDWNLEIMSGMLSTREVAQAMASAKIFLFFCNNAGEGFGLPPFEAAMSGCKVIGYSGLGGSQYWQEPLMTEVEYNDIVSFVDVLDTWTIILKDGSMLEVSDEARQAHSNLMELRSLTEFNNEVVDIVKKLIKE